MAQVIYGVQLPDGTLYEAPDSTPGREAAYIYSRFVADLVAAETGGEVVELDV